MRVNYKKGIGRIKKEDKSIYIVLQYMMEYFLSLLTIAFGVTFADAFIEGKNYLTNWYILILVGLPLFMVARWSIDKNRNKWNG